ncbi:MAG: hypothetical protein PHT12_05140 [Patescibacteria group bacterium]|nr:hypothetical protein [Patescibacteria group bacterium]
MSRRGRASAQRLLRQIFDLMENGGYRVVFTRVGENSRLIDRHHVRMGHVGLHVRSPRTVYVDYRAEVVTVLVHEFTHGVLPDADEDEVQALHELVMSHISASQAKKILDFALAMGSRRRPLG